MWRKRCMLRLHTWAFLVLICALERENIGLRESFLRKMPAQARTCQQLRQVLQSGLQAVMKQLFDEYLLTRLDARKTAGRGKASGGGRDSGTAGNSGRGGRGGGRSWRGRGCDRCVAGQCLPTAVQTTYCTCCALQMSLSEHQCLSTLHCTATNDVLSTWTCHNAAHQCSLFASPSLLCAMHGRHGLSSSSNWAGRAVGKVVSAVNAACRLDAVRAARIRNNPKEEQALLDQARAVTAAAAAKEKASGTEAAGEPSNGHHPGSGRVRGKGQSSARGSGRGRGCALL